MSRVQAVSRAGRPRPRQRRPGPAQRRRLPLRRPTAPRARARPVPAALNPPSPPQLQPLPPAHEAWVTLCSSCRWVGHTGLLRLRQNRRPHPAALQDLRLEARRKAQYQTRHAAPRRATHAPVSPLARPQLRRPVHPAAGEVHGDKSHPLLKCHTQRLRRTGGGRPCLLKPRLQRCLQNKPPPLRRGSQ